MLTTTDRGTNESTAAAEHGQQQEQQIIPTTLDRESGTWVGEFRDFPAECVCGWRAPPTTTAGAAAAAAEHQQEQLGRDRRVWVKLMVGAASEHERVVLARTMIPMGCYIYTD